MLHPLITADDVISTRWRRSRRLNFFFTVGGGGDTCVLIATKSVAAVQPLASGGSTERSERGNAIFDFTFRNLQLSRFYFIIGAKMKKNYVSVDFFGRPRSPTKEADDFVRVEKVF